MPAASSGVPSSPPAVFWCPRRSQSRRSQSRGGAGSLQGADSEHAGSTYHTKTDGPRSREDKTATQYGHSQGKPGSVAGQAGPGRGGECYGREEKELAEGGGEENDDAEGGGLASSDNWSGAGQKGDVLGPLM